jgi:hypothetical protein
MLAWMSVLLQHVQVGMRSLETGRAMGLGLSPPNRICVNVFVVPCLMIVTSNALWFAVVGKTMLGVLSEPVWNMSSAWQKHDLSEFVTWR